MKNAKCCSTLLLLSFVVAVKAWHTPKIPSTQIKSVSSSSTRRSFLLIPPVLTTAAASLLLQTTTILKPLPASASATTRDAALTQWKASVTTIDTLVENWETTTKGGGDAVRRELGTQGVSSPLFQIDKALKILRNDADDLIEFTEQAEEFSLTLSRADSMAYSANFAGGSGKPTPPKVYIDKAEKEVADLQRIAKSLSKLI